MLFFFFKQKTAYEMRISDWSSDVCSSDLDAGVAALLFTDVGRDGLLKGCNVEATVALARAVENPVIASGGVAGIQVIHVLRGHVADGIVGVITGRALYVGRLVLAEAISVAGSPPACGRT